MKLSTFASSIALIASLSANLSFAIEGPSEQAKGAGAFTAGAVIGTMAAGPIGMVLGAFGGAFLNEQNKSNKMELAAVQQSLEDMEQEVAARNDRISELENTTNFPLDFLVMFGTGEDTLSLQDEKLINSLATYLRDNPELKVRLDGYADPRGTDEYNYVLSEERALSVADALQKRGIAADRISYYSHGADLSTAYQGDMEAYAVERRVDIEIYADHEKGSLASHSH